ncbi:DNA-directed RNA polymerase specialized sigma subunit, sigma24 family [Faunimonas pinastri]|uniref:DNA-directed RNA polymerase specialized sigma subunit, sigma24 family n=1 Tax=Faunimonas pinastri TaxID=1855383 RepID=A0A1H9MZA4_9HYPH|nr:sigma factor [Faunimonas pinastri]SER28857.1 DNA-directed RNA polymerase specialized sigma subunit, sigma24 family [Faunimonas pinastri]
MQPEITYESSQPLIRGFARKVLQRVHAAGARGVEFEDIVQELSIAWCLARDAWKAEYNVPFGAFLTRGMKNHINRFLADAIGDSHMTAISLDKNLGEDGEGASLHSVFPDAAPLPEQSAIERDSLARVLRRLSPRARQFVELLENPPPELFAEIQAIKAKSEYARSRGINTYAPNQLTAGLIFDLMGANRVERQAIYHEVRSITGVVSQ